MPRHADHRMRRQQILDGLIRSAARGGLHTVSMRSVAAEAGVSLRLVQYYFGSKAELMHSAVVFLEEKSNERWRDRLAGMSDPASTRSCLDAFFVEALPADQESRTFQLLWMSYAVLAMTDRELAAQPFVEGPNRLEHELASTLRSAQQAGHLKSDADVEREAALLLSISHGLCTSVLVGRKTPDEAISAMHYHLDRVFETLPEAQR